MKFTICGFNQKALSDYGMDTDHTILLRWFVDFLGTGKMTLVSNGGKQYYWVNYQAVIEDLPILQTDNRRKIARMFDNLVTYGILEKYIRRDGGVFTCFRLVEKEYSTLVSEASTPVQEQPDPCQSTDNPCSPVDIPPVQNCTDPMSKIEQTKDQSIKKDQSTRRSSKRGTAFRRPTVQEVREYCEERKNGVDPERFCDFYEMKGWMVGKNKMKDWKAAVRTWEKRDRKENPGEGKGKQLSFSEKMALMASEVEEEPDVY